MREGEMSVGRGGVCGNVWREAMKGSCEIYSINVKVNGCILKNYNDMPPILYEMSALADDNFKVFRISC